MSGRCAITAATAGNAPLRSCSTRSPSDSYGNPAARWRWFDAVPALTIWHRNRAVVFDDSEFDWRGEGALLTRPLGAVQWRPLSRAGAALLDACAAGAPLAVALDAAAEMADEQEIGQLLPALIEAGAFAAQT